MERIKMLFDQYRNQIMIGMAALIVLLLILLSVLFINKPNASTSKNNLTSNSEISSLSHSEVESRASVQENKEEVTEIYVDIKGAVKNPGVYRLKSNLRCSNVIDMAGGLTKKANVKKINLAQKVNDQQVLYIPQKGEKVPDSNVNDSTSQVNNSSSSTSEVGNKININTADVTQLQQITGIGEKRAEQIINYRKEHGEFKKIEDLKQVSGIGDKMLENMKDSISI